MFFLFEYFMLVPWNNISFIVINDGLDCFMIFDHLLMMTSALDWFSCFYQL